MNILYIEDEIQRMLENEFIFSDKFAYRIQRHLIYWFCYWLYFGLLHAANSFGSQEIMYFSNLPYTLTESVLLLIPQMLLTYPIIYWVLPKYFLQKKYLVGLIATLSLIFVGGVVSYFMVIYFNPPVLSAILPEKYMRFPKRPDNVNFLMGVLVNWKGGLLCSATASGIKLMKHWYQYEYKNSQLQKQHTEAQLKLLRAQVNPHFIFNTLNNIYSQTQVESPKGSKMILALSEILRYSIYQGAKDTIALQKEIEIIIAYIELEKIRYGNKLEMYEQYPTQSNHLLIAPFMLLPFVENCFKHGASKTVSNPWISITIHLNHQELHMKLLNGKPANHSSIDEDSGLGIQNIKSRLELIYPNRHQLIISNEEEVFIVDLTIQLESAQIALTPSDEKQNTYAPA